MSNEAVCPGLYQIINLNVRLAKIYQENTWFLFQMKHKVNMQKNFKGTMSSQAVEGGPEKASQRRKKIVQQEKEATGA